MVSEALNYLNKQCKEEIVGELKLIIGELDALIISLESQPKPKPKPAPLPKPMPKPEK